MICSIHRVLKKNWSRSLNLESRGRFDCRRHKLSAAGSRGESQRGFWNSRLQEMHSEAILSIFCHWILLKFLVLWKAFFFVKYTTMLYRWQLVKNKVIQSNCIFLAPVLKLNSSMDYLPFWLKKARNFSLFMYWHVVGHEAMEV
jgi:hypothetical protein